MTAAVVEEEDEMVLFMKEGFEDVHNVLKLDHHMVIVPKSLGIDAIFKLLDEWG